MTLKQKIIDFVFPVYLRANPCKHNGKRIIIHVMYNQGKENQWCWGK